MMEENYQIPAHTDDAQTEKASTPQDDGASGVTIVRASTPRPFSSLEPAKTSLPRPPSASTAHFPSQAPDAPPLPEVPVETDKIEGRALSQPRSHANEVGPAMKPSASEFLWLFEYALDMDPAFLNRPERLAGSAFVYGPAMLKGYRVVFEGLDPRTGQVIASLKQEPSQPEAEVWGMLYRVPERLTHHEQGETARLDSVHLAQAFVPIEVQVRELYRQRDITCLTYVASESTRRQVGQLTPSERLPEPAYGRRLLQIARRQKLPMSYVRILEAMLPSGITSALASPETPPVPQTETLPAVFTKRYIRPRASKGAKVGAPDEGIGPGSAAGKVSSGTHQFAPWKTPYPVGVERWLMTFAFYICLLLLSALFLAIFQGLAFWPNVFNSAFIPLGIPWYVLLYGLLGGCVSCIVTLNRPTTGYPPIFVILTWFMRPFLGAVLAAFAYLLLTSGAILLSTQPAQHFALSAAAGALAGLCESKLVLRRKVPTDF